MHRKWKLLTAAIVVVVGLWSAAWFALRSIALDQMDKALVQLAADGTEITCPSRSLTGFPFRVELTCTNPTAKLPDGTRVEIGRLAVIGVIDDPMLAVAAFEAPIKVTAPDGQEIRSRFSSMKASLRFTDFQPSRLSVAADALVVEQGPPDETVSQFTADHGEVHFRPGAAADSFDAASNFVKGQAVVAGDYVLPFPTDAGINFSVTQYPLLQGGSPAALAAWSAAKGNIKLTEAYFVAGDSRISASGTATIAADGQPQADIALTGKGLDWYTTEAKAGKPVPAILTTLVTAFSLLGKTEADGTRSLPVKVENGAASAGMFKLPVAIPPLFSAGS